MATIDFEVAQELIEKLRKQKRPRVYCVVRYHNAVFNKECWAYFSNKAEYEAALKSENVRNFVVLWWSDRCKEDILAQEVLDFIISKRAENEK